MRCLKFNEKGWLMDELFGCSILHDIMITNRYSALSPMTAYTVNVRVLLTKSFYSERIGFVRSHENCKNIRPFRPDLLYISWTKYIVETLKAVFSYKPETVPDKWGADTVQTVSLFRTYWKHCSVWGEKEDSYIIVTALALISILI